MLGVHDSIEVGQSTEYAKEMRKWEAHHSKWGAPGRPFKFEEFPQQMYKARRGEKGIEVEETRQAMNADEQRNLESRGFYVGPKAAFDAVEKEQQVHGELAAEREYAIRHGRLSENAAAEVRQAEAAHGAKHLPDVPHTPVKRHRRTKAQMAPDAAKS
jgi:hypothetical protein